MHLARNLSLVIACVVASAACSDAAADTATTSPTSTSATTEPSATDRAVSVIDPGDNGTYDVEIDPAAFTSVVDHPYLPKLAGARWEYRSTDPDGEVEIIAIEVLDEHRMVMGVDAIVVHDVVTTEDGGFVEDTYDWFAQDDDGNVWYFGEDTTSYHDGVASKAGSWEAGVGGALPGIVMPATPEVTAIGYRQEYLAGEAEDMGQVIANSGEVTVPAGSFDDVIVTRDWTPLEPDTVELKTYARGVGFVHETKAVGPKAGEIVELVEFIPARTTE